MRYRQVVEPGNRIFVGRAAVIPSKQLSRRRFRALEEIANIYTKMLGNVLTHASRNIIENHCTLRNEKHQELRKVYLNIPSHYIWCLSRCN
ncbi:MAG: hypothetical protein RQ885_04150 [Desulfurococcales archaeon]|jgi:hypothetical protein|nr:hypothetical protein [Desulfurococcales archaeon]